MRACFCSISGRGLPTRTQMADAFTFKQRLMDICFVFMLLDQIIHLGLDSNRQIGFVREYLLLFILLLPTEGLVQNYCNSLYKMRQLQQCCTKPSQCPKGEFCDSPLSVRAFVNNFSYTTWSNVLKLHVCPLQDVPKLFNTLKSLKNSDCEGNRKNL